MLEIRYSNIGLIEYSISIYLLALSEWQLILNGAYTSPFTQPWWHMTTMHKWIMCLQWNPSHFRQLRGVGCGCITLHVGHFCERKQYFISCFIFRQEISFPFQWYEALYEAYNLKIILQIHHHGYYNLWLLLLTWLSNHMPSKVWDEITYPFLNVNGCSVEV